VFWRIESYPTCQNHVFLSHCAEDRSALIQPVYEKLSLHGISSWIDRHDYPYGRDSRSALKDSILRSRHSIFFITDAMLTSARGWCVMELTFAEILQANLTSTGGVVCNAILPLFFVSQADTRLPRSVWQFARDRGTFHDSTLTLSEVDWAAMEIRKFLDREQKLAAELNKSCKSNSDLESRLNESGILERVTKFKPNRLSFSEV
jgi:hypothetical protein